MRDELLYEAHDVNGTMTVNRLRARNTPTFTMYERLAEIAAEPGAVRFLDFTSVGDKVFAPGIDIGQFCGAEDATANEARLDRVPGVLKRCPVPTIAAIADARTVGGTSIAAACDLRMTCGEQADFREGTKAFPGKRSPV